jgi:hypothetical protein
MRYPGALVVATCLAALAGAGASAHAQPPEGTRFAVIDLSPSADSATLAAEVERQVERLRPGSKRIDDPVMRRLLAVGEGPAQTATRLVKEAEAALAAGDCDAAVARGAEAEPLILAQLSLDDERELLKSIYGLLVICADKRGKPDELQRAALRLRAMVALPPAEFPLELWERHVAGATEGEPSVELVIDSDPANAQIAVNLHGTGTTPRTLKVPPGIVYVEIQKDGFRKTFRAVEARAGRRDPLRVVTRLIPRTQDRIEQAQGQLPAIRKGDPDRRPLLLSRLAQLVRAEALVLLTTSNGRVKITFFDADRGAMAAETIDSAYDAATGVVAALATRDVSKAPPAQGKAPAAAPPVTAQGGSGAPAGGAKPDLTVKPEGQPDPGLPLGQGALPEARAREQYAEFKPRPKREGAAWWSWIIAGAVAAGFFAFVFIDRDKETSTIGARAVWNPPPGM